MHRNSTTAHRLIFISPALFAENIGLSETLMNVDLRPGVDLPMLRAELDADPALAALSLEPGHVDQPSLFATLCRHRPAVCGSSRWSPPSPLSPCSAR